MKEDQIQQQVVSYLSFIAKRCNFIFYAPCNEGFMMIMKKFRVPMKIQYAIMGWLGKMGFTPGVSDLVIGHNGKMYCMELKTAIGTQLKSQKIFESNCNKTDIPYTIVRSLEDCQRLLREWGIV